MIFGYTNFETYLISELGKNHRRFYRVMHILIQERESIDLEDTITSIVNELESDWVYIAPIRFVTGKSLGAMESDHFALRQFGQFVNWDELVSHWLEWHYSEGIICEPDPIGSLDSDFANQPRNQW